MHVHLQVPVNVLKWLISASMQCICSYFILTCKTYRIILLVGENVHLSHKNVWEKNWHIQWGVILAKNTHFPPYDGNYWNNAFYICFRYSSFGQGLIWPFAKRAYGSNLIHLNHTCIYWCLVQHTPSSIPPFHLVHHVAQRALIRRLIRSCQNIKVS